MQRIERTVRRDHNRLIEHFTGLYGNPGDSVEVRNTLRGLRVYTVEVETADGRYVHHVMDLLNRGRLNMVSRREEVTAR